MKWIVRLSGIASVLEELSHSLNGPAAWEDPRLRHLADYYRVVNIGGSGSGDIRKWPPSIYSSSIRPA